jgi:2-C-methyl-D-erythritol 4-phosphate cytidylyltransferase/2-C-methyl-D-erythritol 2,4-cyclodiphosphate synthase
MTDLAALPPFAAIIVAAGKGLRAGGETPKQFAMWNGKPLLRHSAESLVNAGCESLVVIIPANAEAVAKDALTGLPGITFVIGGETRQQSVHNGLEALANSGPARVLIHDAARPDLPRQVIARLLDALQVSDGAIPVLPVVDSLAIDASGMMAGAADRNVLRRVQTPQVFRYAAILDAHRNWQGDPDAGDDAQVLKAAGLQISLVPGDERLKKMTFAEDFVTDQKSANILPIRVGSGFDVHRLVAGEELWLCGLKIDHDKGLAGHSDADVALHTVVDALLGAVGAGDIGTHFPPSDPQWKGAPSPLFVEHAVKLVAQAGYAVGNVDLTIICEEPKIGPHRDAMRKKLAELLSTDLSQVSVKATTTERLGFTGRSEGIAAQAIVSVIAN